MLLIAVCLVIVVSVPVAGGNVERLTERPIRWPWLPVAALVGQTFVISVLDLTAGVAAALHVATYVPLGAFLVVNRRRAGLWIIGLGFLCNSAAIIANSGVMPADPAALERAGIESTDEFANSAAVEHPRLRWLGDVFAVPEQWPMANVFSVGDVVIVAGLAVFGHVEAGSRLAPGRRRSGADVPAV